MTTITLIITCDYLYNHIHYLQFFVCYTPQLLVDEHLVCLCSPAVLFMLLLHFRPLFRSRIHSTRTRATMTKLCIMCYSFRHRTPTKVYTLSPLTIPSIRCHSTSPFSAVRPRYHPAALYKRFEAKHLAGDVSERLGRFGCCASCQERRLSGHHSTESPHAIDCTLCKLSISF